MTIEQVLAVRRKQCVGMADNMLSGLNKMLSELFRGLPIVQANTCRELLLKVMEGCWLILCLSFLQLSVHLMHQLGFHHQAEQLPRDQQHINFHLLS